MLEHLGRRIVVTGIVQGVGFRPWVYRLAREHGLTGRVSNDSGGVRIEAFGDATSLTAFVARLRAEPPAAAVIDGLTEEAIAAERPPAFVIATSGRLDERRVSIPPDLATCDACLAELRDPTDRRHRYPFINCTNCGPRFTIARDVPYDRATTTMASFPMCDACRAEYEAPLDRRFHAEPIACPACGPVLTWHDARSRETSMDNPLGAAVLALRDGRIVAVKGLGGFHLACDAASAAAVTALRERKHRAEKPFAVMVGSLAVAETLAHLDETERHTLTSVMRPIVLVRRRDAAGLAAAVAPDNPRMGLMLPYTPVHHLLLDGFGGPLVMTSGNLSDEPLAYRNDEARTRLAALADGFLLHDRDIESPCDDSVVRVMAGAPMVLRRARGYVPRAVRLANAVARPVLGCGALLKNTFCLAIGREAWLGPHIGDLDTLATLDYFEESIDRLERFLQVRAEVVAHDLHPDCHSTRYALGRTDARILGVQHHHAHAASVMAEHHLDGDVLALAWDGTGFGTDRAAWGGELLLAGATSCERLATFRPLRLAGGDSAIRQVWRTALALLIDTYGAAAPVDAFPVFRDVPASDLAVVRRMIVGDVNAPRAHGVGRYFDGFGALGLGRGLARYEGQVAALWNDAADPRESTVGPWALDRSSTPWTIDLRPAVRDAVDDLSSGRPASRVSARFHHALVAAGAAAVKAAIDLHGPRPVVLTGGVFQNAWLVEGLVQHLSALVPVYVHREVPPGDGGIALGQIVVADALTRAGAI